MTNEEILKKIMDDHDLSPAELGRKIGKNENLVSTIKTGATKKLTPKVIRLMLDHFPEYSADWLRTVEPPIYASEVTIHGSGNIGNGNNNNVTTINVTTINERLLAAVEQMCETARIHAEAAKTNAETIAQLLKLKQQ